MFFAVPKTATHAVRTGLRPWIGDGWEQQSLVGESRSPVAGLAAIGHGHLSVTDLEQHMPNNSWRNLHKFAVVRNPYDRFVSACTFLLRGNQSFLKDPRAWMLAALDRQAFRERVLVRPQASQLTANNGAMLMDSIIHYERLNEGMSELYEKFGIPFATLPHINESSRGAKADYFDFELAEKVARFYAADFEIGGYSVNSWC